MKERPMLYTGAMVRAVLADAKTMTRRPMKVQPSEGSIVTVERYEPAIVSRSGELVPGPEIFGAHWGDGEFGIVCPYGQPGDRLWVRETCRAEELESGQDGVRYLADNHFRPINDTPGDAISWMRLHAYGKQGSTNVPSIHMPRWASRILLEITDIRVERLQDISESDVIAEGCPSEILYGRGWYRDLWEQLYGSGSWDANPYVWRISFKKVEA
ncbi:hypothetical protein [Chromobacterium haemolyticum]|uniref:hypothetical protein n=1 Tax=Chromobacterium haemolyticum TaxID=394935 RepID=UPI000D3106F2|nr:hypothetical protein [Chromobacterium haemolyticum]PTU70810.1 hypothetical protein DBB33_15795 [Chromobacterium haemolyticum]